MLDSSPMPTYQPPPAPSKTRSLKRSASVASLPTPPRSLDKTQRKRDIKRRRGDDSESDTGGEEADEHIPKQFHGKLDFGVKPLKALGVSNDPFSDVEPTKTPMVTTTPLSPEKSPSPRGKAASRAPPLTPSPSRITRATAKKLNIDMPVRDTPNNPFLDSQSIGPKKKRPSSSKLKTSTPSKVPYEEQPTLTYVFRGQKTEFVNPHYKLSKEALLASQLPVEHVDYEASETLKPIRLFKEEMAKKNKSKTPDPKGDTEGSEPKSPKSPKNSTPKTPKTPRTPVRGKKAKASGGGGGGWSSSEEESSPTKPKTPKRRLARRT